MARERLSNGAEFGTKRLVTYIRQEIPDLSKNVVAAFLCIDRLLFIPQDERGNSGKNAYFDKGILLKKYLSSMSQPRVVALFAELADLKGKEKVLEVGSDPICTVDIYEKKVDGGGGVFENMLVFYDLRRLF